MSFLSEKIKISTPSWQIHKDLLSSYVQDLRQTVKQLTPINHWSPYVHSLAQPALCILKQPNYYGGGEAIAIKAAGSCIIDYNQYPQAAPVVRISALHGSCILPQTYYGGGLATSINVQENCIVGYDQYRGYGPNGEMISSQTPLEPVVRFTPDVATVYNQILETYNQLRLVDEDNIQAQNLSRVLHESLTSYADTQDESHLIHAIQVVYHFTHHSKKQIKNSIDRIKSFSKPFFTKLKRDLRQSFRNIIMIMFKNLDTEDRSAATLIVKQASLNFQNLIYYEQKRNYKVFGSPYKV